MKLFLAYKLILSVGWFMENVMFEEFAAISMLPDSAVTETLLFDIN
jgi:hypothetical protein